ncbi:MAG: J domain-containing protein [Allosphingosinicella sp.]|uniref:J domain-containing protein n=1 Tax=Allosphingosinicella sp. TaxID=2823234 RepID=UPI0039574185
MPEGGRRISYYERLGVPADADPRDIRAAYLRLMKHHHPDVAGSRRDQEAARELNEAFAVLRDPDRRRLYDQDLARERARPAPPPPPMRPPPGHIYRPIVVRRPRPSFAARTLPLLLPVLIAAAAGGLYMRYGELPAPRVPLPAPAVEEEVRTPTAAPLPPVDYAMVQKGVEDLGWIAGIGGVAEAASYSRRCFEQFEEAPSALLFDRCAAFDNAAFWWQAEQRDGPPSPRFSSVDMSVRHEDSLKRLSLNEEANRRRLQRIHSAAVTALAEMSLRAQHRREPVDPGVQ